MYDSSILSFTRAMPSGSEMSTSTRSSSSTSSTRLFMTVTMPDRPFPAASFSARPAIPDASTAYTRLAPAFAAKKDRIPVPAPTSTTVLPSKSILFSSIEN